MVYREEQYANTETIGEETVFMFLNIEYEGYYEVYLERFNPLYHPIEHLIYDAPNCGPVGLICLEWPMPSKNNQNTSRALGQNY